MASEQDLWAVDAAKRILNGATPASIPITRNRQAVTWINAPLAAMIGFERDSALLEGGVLLEQTASGERRQEEVPPDHP